MLLRQRIHLNNNIKETIAHLFKGKRKSNKKFHAGELSEFRNMYFGRFKS